MTEYVFPVDLVVRGLGRFSVSAEYKVELVASGIPPALAEEHCFTIKVQTRGFHDLLYKTLPEDCHPALAFVGFDARNNPSSICVKVNPDSVTAKSGKKYLNPTGGTANVFFPKNVLGEIHQSKDKILIITEGPKKTLSLYDMGGYLPIGLSGVEGWSLPKSKRTKLRPDLAKIDWKGRKVIIVFDSDLRRIGHEELLKSLDRLVQLLRALGATVLVVDIPDDENDETDGAKVGIDDYRVKHGDQATRELLEKAYEPDYPKLNIKKLVTFEPLRDAYLDSLPQEQRLAYWKGQYYARDPDRGFYLPQETADPVDNAMEFLNRTCEYHRMGDAEELVKQVRGKIKIYSDQLPAWRAPAPDGFEDLTKIVVLRKLLVHAITGQTAPNDGNLFTLSASPTDFDPYAPPNEVYDNFMRGFTGDQQQSINILEEFLGYCLTQDTSFQKMLYIDGDPGSGKDTWFNLLEEIIGPDNIAAMTFADFGGPFGLEGLETKKVLVLRDFHMSGGHNHTLAIERLSAMVGGGTVTINRKFRPQLTNVRLTLKAILMSNQVPYFCNTSLSWLRRMLIVPSVKTENRAVDADLGKKIIAAGKSAILNRALAAYQRLKQQGKFTDEVEAAQDIRGTMRELFSPINTFIDENLLIGNGLLASKVSLYLAWCSHSGTDHSRENKSAVFFRDLPERLPHTFA